MTEFSADRAAAVPRSRRAPGRWAGREPGTLVIPVAGVPGQMSPPLIYPDTTRAGSAGTASRSGAGHVARVPAPDRGSSEAPADLLALMAARDAEREARGEQLHGWRLELECGHVFRLADKPAEAITCPASSCAGRKRIVAADYLGARCRSCEGDIPLKDAHGGHYYLCLACRGARIPARCPYKPGDRVQVHGQRGNRRLGYEPSQGWRGVVEGYFGATILTGITDDRQTWSENWGGLVKDGTPPADPVIGCTCCPGPAIQLDLFGNVA